MYTDWRKDNYFQAVKEAIGNTSEFETSTFKIGIECDHMSVQISQKLENLYDGRRRNIYTGVGIRFHCLKFISPTNSL